jgi:hypothetical protein
MQNRASILAVVFLFAILMQSQANRETEKLDLDKTKELAQKSLGEISFAEATLESRIANLRTLTTKLGIELTVSKGVVEASRQLTYPAFTLKKGNLAQALRYTCANTKLTYKIQPGEIHLSIIGETTKIIDHEHDHIDESDSKK